MRSLSFLISRRWLLFAVVIALSAGATWWLGQWQFDRLEQRRESNSVISANEQRDPAPVDEVLAPGREVEDDDLWRVVSATGTYDPSRTILIRYSGHPTTDDSGVDVVVPLVTEDGTAVLVNRGWMPTLNRGGDVGDTPAPPAGEVTVTGYVRADGSGDSTRVVDGSTRAVDSERVGEAVGLPVYGGWLELASEDPEPAEKLVPVALPELDEGPHFFYGLQWWFFGLLAIIGFCWFAYDEWRGGPARGRRTQAAAAGAGSAGSAGAGGIDRTALRDERRARRERYKQAVAAEEARVRARHEEAQAAAVRGRGVTDGDREDQDAGRS